MSVHTGEKPYMCAHCGKQFATKGNLQHHMHTHSEEKPFYCKVCGKGFIEALKLQAHMYIHSGEAPHFCLYCDRVFRQASALAKHMRKHPAKTRRQRRFNIQEDSPYGNCKLCIKGFIKADELQSHVANHRKSYTCGSCNMIKYLKQTITEKLVENRNSLVKATHLSIEVQLVTNIFLLALTSKGTCILTLRKSCMYVRCVTKASLIVED